MSDSETAIVIEQLVKKFGDTTALQPLDATIAKGQLTGLVGPDGAGKTTLMRIIAALLTPDSGNVRVLGQDTADQSGTVNHLMGYMPQRFGLYEDLSVMQNLHLYADLKGLSRNNRDRAIDRLLEFTRLNTFTTRQAGKLSGGMKQKLGLACALLGKPRILLLDEPSVGVDPISRQELWQMVQDLTDTGMAVLWSTAYLDEAERCGSVLLFDQGHLLYKGPPDDLTHRLKGRSYRVSAIAGDRRRFLSAALAMDAVDDGVIQGATVRLVRAEQHRVGVIEKLSDSWHAKIHPTPPRFEDAFIDLLGGASNGRSALAEQMDVVQSSVKPMVECRNLCKRFSQFTAADNISFSVKQGEVFGLLGPNGAGKSTTFKMLCGLLRPSSGSAMVAGYDLRTSTARAKSQLGYMAQKFSLYGLLSVKQNLDFFSGAYGLSGNIRKQRIDEMIDIFKLAPMLNQSPDNLPLGFRQRLALACALMHRPRVLFLDEPTSGVDPLTRREFWTHISGLVAKGITVLVTTHFMDEAEYCDRVCLVQQGKLVELDTPDSLKASIASSTLPDPCMEQAFIQLVERRHSAQIHPLTSRSAREIA